jgi:thymidylate synthase (FAD)
MSIQSRINALPNIEDLETRLSTGEKLRSLLNDRNTGRLLECLDDGFVRLVDHMGNDAAIVQAARVSYGTGTKAVSDDRSLIRYLISHRHTSPLEMVEFKFHVRVPMDCWRQWIRHRCASVNEYSTRYSEAIDSRSMTNDGQWRLQANDRKQGSDDFLPPEQTNTQTVQNDLSYYEFTGKYLSKREAELHELADRVYQERLDAGVAREQARKDLPLSTYTEAYWKIDGNNLFHFLGLRMDKHAQLEIRTYANAIAKLIQGIVPFAWEAFEDYQLNAMTLSQQEVWEIYGLLHPDNTTGCKPLGKREKKELAAKLERLGIG